MKTKFKRQLALLSILILSMTILSGCSSDPKTFTEKNVSVTLTKAFKVEPKNNFDVYITSDTVVFTAVEETASELEQAGYEIASLNGYCQEILSLNNTSTDKLIKRNNYYYFTNTKTINGAKYTYVHCMFAEKESYWICEFVCKTKHYNKMESRILAWADSITFVK